MHFIILSGLNWVQSVCEGYQQTTKVTASKEKVLHKFYLSYDAASGSEIMPCNKIDKPLVLYRFTGNIMQSITTLRT